MKRIDPNRLVHVTNRRYRQHFHIQTPAGWLNDPNGLCYFKGYYHVFYQFHPYSAEWGPMHWGHVRSKDLVHWEQLPVALVPGDPEDSGGCFSGSAIVKAGRLYLIYTGHHYYGDHDLDHFWENQNVAYSDDGIHFTKYAGNPVISAPQDNTKHFRDPKVWLYDGQYYLVIGSQDAVDHLGRILLYRSADLLHWQALGPIFRSKDASTEGYMWECPDFFRLNGQDVLVCSPMGIKATPHRFLNENQVAYFTGQLDYQQPHYAGGKLAEVDCGHNFYAPQSFLTPDGRWVQFGWMSSFSQSMPEQADGWAGCLTVPREVILTDHHLGTIPVKELASLRQATLFDQPLIVDRTNELSQGGQHCEVQLTVPFADGGQFSWALVTGDHPLVSLDYNHESGWVTVHQDGQKSDRYAHLGPVDQLNLQILVDTSSVEIFINHGAATFTERYYTEEPVTYQLNSSTPRKVLLKVYQLEGKEL